MQKNLKLMCIVTNDRIAKDKYFIIGLKKNKRKNLGIEQCVCKCFEKPMRNPVKLSKRKGKEGLKKRVVTLLQYEVFERLHIIFINNV